MRIPGVFGKLRTPLQIAAAIAASATGSAAKTMAIATSRDLSTASGTQNITGAGFRPKGALVFQCLLNSDTASVGIVGGSNVNKVMGYVPSVGWSFNGSSCLYADKGGGAFQLGTGTFTADGMDVAWTKTGSPTGTIDIFILFWA